MLTVNGAAGTEISYTMTVDDLVDGGRLVQRPLRRFAIMLGVVACIAGAGLVLAGDRVLGAAAVIYGLLDLAIMVAGRPMERFAVRRRAGRLIGNECDVGLGARAVTFRNGGASGEIAWSELTGIREDARTIGLATGGALRLGIPKRAFASQAELATFRQQVSSRIEAGQTGARV